MREQAQRAFDRIRHIVESEGGQIDDIVSIRIFVSQADADSFRAIHSVRGAMWPAGKFPASTLVLAGIAVDGGLIEVDADAVIPRKRSYEAADTKRQ